MVNVAVEQLGRRIDELRDIHKIMREYVREVCPDCKEGKEYCSPIETMTCMNWHPVYQKKIMHQKGGYVGPI